MPTEMRVSGPEFMRDGQMVTPRAAVHFCEVCGAENAPFGILRHGEVLSYCGWGNGEPVCKNSPSFLAVQKPGDQLR